jgi:hypothetical protein
MNRWFRVSSLLHMQSKWGQQRQNRRLHWSHPWRSKPLLEPASIRALFKKHKEQAARMTRWVAPHQAQGANNDAPEAVLENGVLKYDDGSLVGRRCTAFVSPEEGDDSFEEGYYAATIVAFNSRAASHKGRYLLHFDDGQRERVDLPDDTVRIMTACVSICKCQDSP